MRSDRRVEQDAPSSERKTAIGHERPVTFAIQSASWLSQSHLTTPLQTGFCLDRLLTQLVEAINQVHNATQITSLP